MAVYSLYPYGLYTHTELPITMVANTKICSKLLEKIFLRGSIKFPGSVGLAETQKIFLRP
jgi:hypothetical protein